jgi:hypothetical protein
MRKLLFFALTFIILTSLKCKHNVEPLGEIQFTFKPIYNNAPLVINKVYDYNGKKIRFTRLSFFISPTILVPTSEKQSTQVIPLLKANFTDLDTDAKAADGIKFNLKFIQTSYSNITMGIGVNENSNSKKPKDFPSESPLSDAGDYWDDWKSYIFSKLEGSMDKDGDGRFETGITLHTGGNEVYQNVSFRKNYDIKDMPIANLEFSLDLNKLLTGIDLTTINATHQTGDLPTMKKLMGNFPTALTLK